MFVSDINLYTDVLTLTTTLGADNNLMSEAMRIGFKSGKCVEDIIEEALALWVEHNSQELSYKYIDKY